MIKVSVSVLLIGAFLALVSNGKHIPYFAGPYEIVFFRNINETDDSPSVAKFWCKLYFSRFSRGEKQYVWGSSYNSIPLDSNIMVELRMSQWLNNQWKPNAHAGVFRRGCDDVKAIGRFMMEMVFGEDGKDCPIPSGRRDVKNSTVDPKIPAFPVFPYGRYIVHVRGFLNRSLVGTTRFEAEFIPKL